MKKLLFLFGAAVIMMTSCSSDEVVDVAPTPAIGFNTFMTNSTRAAEQPQTGTATDLVDGENRTFTNFDVWAVKWNNEQNPNQVFAAQSVNLNSGNWEYKPVRYWVTGNNYRFTALAPSKAPGVTITEQSIASISSFEDVKGGLKFTFNNKTAGAAVDLCYATQKLQNVTVAQPAVQLQFAHMLSRVKFTFQNDFESPQSVLLIENVKILNAMEDASINTVDGENWKSLSGNTFVINFSPNSDTGATQMPIDGGGEKKDTKHQYVIPIDEEKTYSVYFKVSLYNHDPNNLENKYTKVDTWEHTIELPVKTFVQNYSYNFIAKLSAINVNPEEQMLPIEFSPSITPWGNFGDSNIDVPTPVAPQVSE